MRRISSRVVVRSGSNVRGLDCTGQALFQEIRALTTARPSKRTGGALPHDSLNGHQQRTKRRKNTPTCSTSRESTKSWEEATVHLIGHRQWSSSHRRKAEQTLQYWSRHMCKPKLIRNLWQKISDQIPRGESSAALFDYAILALAKHGYADKAEALYEQFLVTEFRFTGNNTRHVPNSYHLNAILHAYSRKKQPQQAHSLLLKAFTTKVQPNVYTLTCALDAWSRVGKGQEAQALLDECQKRGVDTSVACFNAVFAAWARDPVQDNFAKVQDLFQRMNVPPDEITWSCVLKSCRDPKKSEELLWKALREGQPINNICFNVVLHKWGLLDEAKAESFFQSWLDAVRDDFPLDLIPTITTFNSMLHTLAKAGAASKAQIWFDKMESFGIKPDGLSYNSLLSAYSRIGDTAKAVELLRKMLELNFPAEQLCFAYNSAISSLAKYVASNPDKVSFAVDKAQHLFSSMKENKVKADVVTFNALLSVYASCASATYAKKAEALIETMESRYNLKPDIVSYSCVIDAWTKSGDPRAGDRALSVLRGMKVPPTVISYNSVIAAFGNDPRKARDAEVVLDEMEMQGVDPDMVTFATLIACWCKSNNSDKARNARRVLDLMKVRYLELRETEKTETVRDVFRNAHSLVVKACSMLPDKTELQCRKDALEIAKMTLEETSDPSAVSYATFFWAVFSLVDDIEDREGLITDAFFRYQDSVNHPDNLVLKALKQTLAVDSYENVIPRKHS